MRDTCWRCWRSTKTCLCERVRSFETDTTFVILIHPRELKNRVGTGRIVKLFVKNSELIDGSNFEGDPRVSRWLVDSSCECFVLYPGKSALNLSQMRQVKGFQNGDMLQPDSGSETDRLRTRQNGRRKVVFVIDGTWSQAKKMLRVSPSLAVLPQLSFDPEKPSSYRIREQPGAICLSTLEAVHTLIGLLEPEKIEASNHMVRAFDWMVEEQIRFEQQRTEEDSVRGRVKKFRQSVVF